MTEEERDFHYFTVHDYDKNNFLDGLEVGQLACRQFLQQQVLIVGLFHFCMCASFTFVFVPLRKHHAIYVTNQEINN